MEHDILKILMLEDIEEDAGLVDRALHKGNLKYIRTRVDTAPDFIRALDEFKPDIILSDHSLPQFNSIEALKICHEKNIDAPFILVTGAVSEEFAVSCLKMGAVDYVLKTNLSRLTQAISQAMDKFAAEKNRIQQEEALRRQNEELIKINKELDAFVYRVSHDLRSPLSSILGLTGVARIDGHTSEAAARQYFEMIERNVLRLDETLREIMDYYKNARGEMSIEEVDFRKIINGSFDRLKFSHGFEEIHKEIKIHQDTPFYSDEYRWSVILSNLLSNAVKYRDIQKTGQFIDVVIMVDKEMARVKVCDNGIGIHDEYISKIFDMFYRATEKSQGAGLGLYIVKEMVGKLSGSVHVDSEFGNGTTISIAVPNNSVAVK